MRFPIGAPFSPLPLNSEEKLISIGVGYNAFSYVPKHNSFAAVMQYINRSNNFKWGAALFSRLGPRIDVPRRHLFDAYEVGGSLFGLLPLSTFRRFEVWGGISYLNQEHLEDWSHIDDFSHAEDSLNFSAKGILVNVGGAYVKDNTLWSLSGPIDGTRFRIHLDLTPNVSAIGLNEQKTNAFSELPINRFGPKPTESLADPSTLFSYTTAIDYRRYFRIGMLGTYGIRGFGYYSGGEMPARLSTGKLGGMASFYPWNTPYGSRIWMVNQRLTIPIINGLLISSDVLGNVSFLGIQASTFLDLSQAWLENNSNRGPVWGDYGFGLRIPLFMQGLIIRLDWGKIFTLGDNFEIPEYKQGLQFGWWIGFEF